MNEYEQITNFELELFLKFKNKFDKLVKNINNKKINLNNIILLNEFNKELFNINNTLDEINSLLNDDNNLLLNEKVKNYVKINKAIKDILPFIIKETIND